MVFTMNLLRQLPAVDELQKNETFEFLLTEYQVSRKKLTKWLGESLNKIREQILTGTFPTDEKQSPNLEDAIFNELEKVIHQQLRKVLRPVINATGVVLHTNLGRARLSSKALEQVTQVAKSYSTLEYNLREGRRGSRHDIVEEYVKKITGAEAAIVVNNNAAAVYLTLRALASHQEVIVSRGELIEIGGSFRISEIMEESDATLISVGTSNKTYISDYERAITEDTALLMKVHKSNFDIVGFSAEIESEQLIPLSKRYNIPIYEDLGSGTLFDFKEKSIGKEPTVQEKVASGIDLISFSGDKLLGGPQAGIIVGRKKYIDRLKSHQLARVLRVDKFTLAGLEATLQSYIRGKEVEEIPTIRDIVMSKETVLKRAEQFINKIRGISTGYTLTLQEDISKVGGGTMPTETLETYVVEVKHKTFTSAELARALRSLPYPIIVRIKGDQVLLDFRTVELEEMEHIVEGFLRVDKSS